jgi:hypothetical protein
MGALAAQKYAECHPVSALVLLTPVVPTEVGGTRADCTASHSTCSAKPALSRLSGAGISAQHLMMP